jgi:type III pantothenate kinase
MSRRVLALDVGNTRTKWGLGDQSGWIADGTAAHSAQAELLTAWNRLHNPDRIIGCNVAGETRVSELVAYWRKRGMAITWMHSSARSCGVSSQYEQPDQLGADRWAALIGAWSKIQGPCLVVSAGTAMTIDALDDQGRFLGGHILPGRRLMLESLIAGTHALMSGGGLVKDFPRNTADAVASGIAIALASSIEKAFHRLESVAANKPICVVTGGDADWLVGLLHVESLIEPKLVLAGVMKMAEEET